MPLISDVDLNLVIDYACQGYMRMYGNSASNYGIAPKGSAYAAAFSSGEVLTTILATADVDVVSTMLSGAQAAYNGTDSLAVASGLYSTLFAQLLTHISTLSSPQSRTLDAYLTTLNVTGATKWQALQSPAFYDLYPKFYNGVTPSIWNTYFQIVQGGAWKGTTYTNALAKFIVGTGLTVGTPVDGTKYAGGFPFLNVTAITGTDLVTVTGTAYNPATQTAIPGSTWTATPVSTGAIALTPAGTQPAPANSLIQAVTNIVCGAGISAGTVYVEAHAPTGRITIP